MNPWTPRHYLPCCEPFIVAEDDAQEAYDDWCLAMPDPPRIKYSYKASIDRLGRNHATYVRSPEYKAWCEIWKKAQDQEWRKVERRIKALDKHYMESHP